MPRFEGYVKYLMRAAVALVLVGGGVGGVFVWTRYRAAETPTTPDRTLPHIGLVSTHPDIIRLPADYAESLRVETADVLPAPPPTPLRLHGSLLLDSNHLARIHSLFSGQVMALGDVEVPFTEAGRPLRYGDRVRKGQVLARVWSKDVGEKKSELVDALSKLAVDQKLLDRYLNVEPGVVAQRNVDDARRNVEADVIAVARAERTLRSWRLTDEEVALVKREATAVQRRKQAGDAEVERTWAETNIRSPIDGVIMEKNVTIGDVIDPTVDLFKIVDVQRMQVLANVYEEDIPRLQGLPAQERRWKVSLPTDPNAPPVEGAFEQIGRIIDPTQHTGTVLGWLDNSAGRLRAGQFVTATVELPADSGLLAVPAAALIEEGGTARVLAALSREAVPPRDFTPINVHVVQRGRDQVLIRAEPEGADRGGEPRLRAGDRVITRGNLELAAELDNLKGAPRP
jgi:cobalt-zinc-cadmium efflux system membrane fusion protein